MARRNKVPEGFAFVDWADSLGKGWKDVIPVGFIVPFKLNVMSKGGKIKKVLR